MTTCCVPSNDAISRRGHERAVRLPDSWARALTLLDHPSAPLVAAVAVILLAVLVWHRFQRCPHCGTIVRRSWSLRWLRCAHCHRQYNRSVRRLYRL